MVNALVELETKCMEIQRQNLTYADLSASISSTVSTSNTPVLRVHPRFGSPRAPPGHPAPSARQSAITKRTSDAANKRLDRDKRGYADDDDGEQGDEDTRPPPFKKNKNNEKGGGGTGVKPNKPGRSPGKKLERNDPSHKGGKGGRGKQTHHGKDGNGANPKRSPRPKPSPKTQMKLGSYQASAVKVTATGDAVRRTIPFPRKVYTFYDKDTRMVVEAALRSGGVTSCTPFGNSELERILGLYDLNSFLDTDFGTQDIVLRVGRAFQRTKRQIVHPLLVSMVEHHGIAPERVLCEILSKMKDAKACGEGASELASNMVHYVAPATPAPTEPQPEPETSTADNPGVVRVELPGHDGEESAIQCTGESTENDDGELGLGVASKMNTSASTLDQAAAGLSQQLLALPAHRQPQLAAVDIADAFHHLPASKQGADGDALHLRFVGAPAQEHPAAQNTVDNHVPDSVAHTACAAQVAVVAAINDITGIIHSADGARPLVIRVNAAGVVNENDKRLLQDAVHEQLGDNAASHGQCTLILVDNGSGVSIVRGAKGIEHLVRYTRETSPVRLAYANGTEGYAVASGVRTYRCLDTDGTVRVFKGPVVVVPNIACEILSADAAAHMGFDSTTTMKPSDGSITCEFRHRDDGYSLCTYRGAGVSYLLSYDIRPNRA